ncbi:MAG: bifunctional precorrin-2 dehydrogenase/sirohydrochlorin ferrochelatase [Turneriella sp.]
MHLPLSFDLTDRKVVLIGGGKAALEKFVQLAKTPCELKIITPRFNDDFNAALEKKTTAKLHIELRKFNDGDIDGAFMVFSAIDDADTAERIFQLCRARGILINSADDRARCDFYTNAVIERGSIQVAVSSGGRFAGLSAVLRRHLEALIPAELDQEWEKIFALRERALALQSVSEKKSVITNIVRQLEQKYFARRSDTKTPEKNT